MSCNSDDDLEGLVPIVIPLDDDDDDDDDDTNDDNEDDTTAEEDSSDVSESESPFYIWHPGECWKTSGYLNQIKGATPPRATSSDYLSNQRIKVNIAANE